MNHTSQLPPRAPRGTAFPGGAPRPRAFTLMEAMILVTILGIVGVGAGIGLQSTIHTPKAVDKILAVNAAITSAMEQMRASSISNFSGLTGYSDTVTINGISYNRTVTVAALTAPDGSGATTDYKQVTVQIGSQSMVCIVTQP